MSGVSDEQAVIAALMAAAKVDLFVAVSGEEVQIAANDGLTTHDVAALLEEIARKLRVGQRMLVGQVSVEVQDL